MKYRCVKSFDIKLFIGEGLLKIKSSSEWTVKENIFKKNSDNIMLDNGKAWFIITREKLCECFEVI